MHGKREKNTQKKKERRGRAEQTKQAQKEQEKRGQKGKERGKDPGKVHRSPPPARYCTMCFNLDKLAQLHASFLWKDPRNTCVGLDRAKGNN